MVSLKAGQWGFISGTFQQIGEFCLSSVAKHFVANILVFFMWQNKFDRNISGVSMFVSLTFKYYSNSALRIYILVRLFCRASMSLNASFHMWTLHIIHCLFENKIRNKMWYFIKCSSQHNQKPFCLLHSMNK